MPGDGGAGGRAECGKAGYARRLVQVLEFFDDYGRSATVKQIVIHFGWPQSSTSDLLAVLVDCGLLYKNEDTGCFQPSPRAAMLGAVSQPGLLGAGRLQQFVEKLAAANGLSVAVISKVGLDAQVVSRTVGRASPAERWPRSLAAGAKTPLHRTAAGWLLLSALGPARWRLPLHRLRAEAPAEQEFNRAAIDAQVQRAWTQRYVFGPAGFGASEEFCGILAPGVPADQPLAIGFLFDKSRICPHALVARLQTAVESFVDRRPEDVVRCEPMRASEPPPAIRQDVATL